MATERERKSAWVWRPGLGQKEGRGEGWKEGRGKPGLEEGEGGGRKVGWKGEEGLKEVEG